MTTKLKIFFNSASFTAFILSEGKRVLLVCGSGCVCGYGCGCVRENERGRERGGKKFQPLLTNILSKNIDNEEMEDEDFQTYLEN